MAGWYDTDKKFDLGLVKSAAGGTAAGTRALSNAAMNLGNVKQQSVTRAKNAAQLETENKRAKEALNIKKAQFDLQKQTKEEKAKQDALDRSAKVSGFKKLHPKVTEGMTDDEIYLLGNELNKLHLDKTKSKVIDVFTGEDGNKIAVTWDGSLKDGKPNFVNTVLGKAKDWGKSSTNQDQGGVFVKPLGKRLSESEYQEYLKKSKNFAQMDID